MLGNQGSDLRPRVRQEAPVPDMKCPKCDVKLSAVELLQSGGKTKCHACGSALRVTGLTAFWLVPTIVFAVFPVLAFLDGPGTILIVGTTILVAAYALSFWAFVDVSLGVAEGRESPAVSRPTPPTTTRKGTEGRHPGSS